MFRGSIEKSAAVNEFTFNPRLSGIRDAKLTEVGCLILDAGVATTAIDILSLAEQRISPQNPDGVARPGQGGAATSSVEAQPIYHNFQPRRIGEDIEATAIIKGSPRVVTLRRGRGSSTVAAEEGPFVLSLIDPACAAGGKKTAALVAAVDLGRIIGPGDKPEAMAAASDVDGGVNVAFLLGPSSAAQPVSATLLVVHINEESEEASVLAKVILEKAFAMRQEVASTPQSGRISDKSVAPKTSLDIVGRVVAATVERCDWVLVARFTPSDGSCSSRDESEIIRIDAEAFVHDAAHGVEVALCPLPAGTPVTLGAVARRHGEGMGEVEEPIVIVGSCHPKVVKGISVASLLKIITAGTKCRTVPTVDEAAAMRQLMVKQHVVGEYRRFADWTAVSYTPPPCVSAARGKHVVLASTVADTVTVSLFDAEAVESSFKLLATNERWSLPLPPTGGRHDPVLSVQWCRAAASPTTLVPLFARLRARGGAVAAAGAVACEGGDANVVFIVQRSRVTAIDASGAVPSILATWVMSSPVA